jgi:hypothetical protein
MLIVLNPAAAQTAPSRPVDTRITDYVVFGFNTVFFKGSDIVGRGVIKGGDIGANGLGGSSNPTVNICANKHVTMSDFSQVVGDVVRFTNNCTFWDLFANQVIGSGGGTVHSGPTPVKLPVVTPPTPPATMCDPANPVTITAGSPPTTLPPGTYGDVEFQDGTAVTLEPGLYQMCNFHTGRNVVVNPAGVDVTARPGTEFRITGAFNLGNGTNFGLGAACATYVYARGDGVAANDLTINLGKNTLAAGHFLTDQRLELGNGNDLFGTFWANDVISDFDDNVTYCPPVEDYTFTKSVSGPGAGSQDAIQVHINCVPAPPNSTIPPFVIPAGAPQGDYSTIVTDVTVPAACQAIETATGANARVVIPAGRALATPQTVLCADVGDLTVDPATGQPRERPPQTLANVFEATTGPTSSTASTTTTTAPVTIPDDACVLPTSITAATTTSSASGSSGAPTSNALARTGGGSKGTVAGVLLIGAGLAVLLIRRRVTPTA